jgi:hypothetical protein
MPTQGPSQPVEAIVMINKPAVPPKQTTKSAKVVKGKHASHEDVLVNIYIIDEKRAICEELRIYSLELYFLSMSI